MRGESIASAVLRAVSAARGAFSGHNRGNQNVSYTTNASGSGRPPLKVASWDGTHVAFMERRLRRDVLVPKVLGAQVAFAAVMVHIMRGGLDFMIAVSEGDTGDAENQSTWPWQAGEKDHSSRPTAPGPGAVVDFLPALGFVLVVAATYVRSRGSNLLHFWRFAQAVFMALAMAYAHTVCVASKSTAALGQFLDKDANTNSKLESLSFSVRAFAAIAGETLLADASRLAAGMVPRGVTCLCALAASYSLELHASHLQGVGSVIFIVAAYSAWILSRCDAHTVAGRWQAVLCLTALLLGSSLSISRRYELALERYERIGAINDEADRLREARSDTKRFMAFLFHEIRVPLSVISLGIPSLRDHIAEEDMHDQGLEAVLEQEHAVETTDLMGRSMDVVQRVLGDVLDLLHGSTDEERASLSPEWTDLSSLVNTALVASGPMFERGGALLSPDLPQEVTSKLSKMAILVDPPRLRRALDAILASASGITPPGGVTQVTVNVSEISAPHDDSVAAAAAHNAGFSSKKYNKWSSVDIVLVSKQRGANSSSHVSWFNQLDIGKIVDEQDSPQSSKNRNGLPRTDRTTTANELLKMLREPLHRSAGQARAPRWSVCDSDFSKPNLMDARAAEEALISDAVRRDRVFAPAAAALDLHVARMLSELHGGDILVRDVPSQDRRDWGGTAIIIRVPALTCPMDDLMIERAQDAGEATAAAGPWNNPFAMRIPESPAAATMRRAVPGSRPPSRMGVGAQVGFHAHAPDQTNVVSAVLHSAPQTRAPRRVPTRENTREELKLTAISLARQANEVAEETGERGDDGIGGGDNTRPPRSVRASRASPPGPSNSPSLVAAVAATAAAAVVSNEKARRAAVLRSGGMVGPSSVAQFNGNLSRSGILAFTNTNNRSFRYENEAPATAAIEPIRPVVTGKAPCDPLPGRGSPPALESTETSDDDKANPGNGTRSRTPSDPGTSEENAIDNARNIGSRRQAGNPSTSAKLPSVLVVEDSVPTRTMLVRLLRRLDLDVQEAGNGLEGVRACSEKAMQQGGDQQKPFDLILMDKEMPVMDGHEATKTLRRNGVTAPIIGVTANVLESDREKFISQGLDDFLQKPVSRDDLVSVLQKHGLCGCDPFRAADRQNNANGSKKQKTPEPENVPAARVNNGGGG